MRNEILPSVTSKPAMPSGRLVAASGHDRIAILILGMHRSGTSALARVVSLLGCRLPQTLMPANPANEAGHWESDAIADFNNELLESAGSRWDDWMPFNSNWFLSPVRADFERRCADLLRQEFGNASLFVWKDPRSCRIAPLLFDVMDAQKIRPAIMLPIRNPLEVAASLHARDGIVPGHGLLLWTRHILDAEAASRGRQRLFCTYDQLMASWRVVASRAQSALNLPWPRFSMEAFDDIERFLNPAHRHHQKSSDALLDDPGLSSWLRDTYKIMLHWADGGECAEDYPKLDAIRASFDAAVPAFGHLLIETRKARSRLDAQKDDFEKRAKAHDAQRAAWAADRESLSRAMLDLDQALSRMKDDLSDETATRQGVERSLEDLSLSHRQIEAELSAARVRARVQDEGVAKARADAQALAGERDAAVLQCSLLADERDILAQSVRDMQPRLADVTAELAEEALLRKQRERQLQDAALHRERLETQLTASLHKAREHDEYVATADAELASLKDRVIALESTLRQRQEEISQAWADGDTERAARKTVEEQLEAADAQARDLERQAARLQAELGRQARARQAADRELDEMAGDLAASRRAYDEAQAQVATGSQQLEAALGEIVIMTSLLQQKEAEMTLVAKQIDLLQSDFADMKANILTAEAAKADAEKKLRARFAEITRLSQIYRQQEKQSEQYQGHADWLREVSTIIANLTRWWMLLSPAAKKAKTYRRLKRRGLFDAKAYLERYPDVEQDGIDPLTHYIRHGMEEGRVLAGTEFENGWPAASRMKEAAGAVGAG